MAEAQEHPGIPAAGDRPVALARDTDLVLVTGHRGPNMTARPVAHVRRAAPLLTDAGADLVIDHSAHVFHGFTRHVLFDLGDFTDDYAVHPTPRNDLGLLWLITSTSTARNAPRPPPSLWATATPASPTGRNTTGSPTGSPASAPSWASKSPTRAIA